MCLKTDKFTAEKAKIQLCLHLVLTSANNLLADPRPAHFHSNGPLAGLSLYVEMCVALLFPQTSKLDGVGPVDNRPSTK